MDNGFELRELKSKDIFPMCRILRKIGFKDLKDKLTTDNVKGIMQMFESQNQGEETDQVEISSYVGFNIIAEILDVLLSNLDSCEQDVYKFLAGLTEDKKEQDIAELPLVTFTELIVAVLQKDEFKDFFKVVSKLFDQTN